MERLSGVRPLRRFLPQLTTHAASNIAQQVGAALATIHVNLVIEGPATTLQLSNATNTCTAIHGDFGLWNVQYDTHTGTPAIFDWVTPQWLGEWCTHGPPAWDLSLFLVDLLYMKPLDRTYIRRAGEIRDAFLAGYASVRPIPEDLSPVLTATLRRYLASSATSGTIRVLRLPSLSRLRTIRSQPV